LFKQIRKTEMKIKLLHFARYVGCRHRTTNLTDYAIRTNKSRDKYVHLILLIKHIDDVSTIWLRCNSCLHSSLSNYLFA